MYQYTEKLGWESIADFLAEHQVTEVAEELRLSGYRLTPSFGVGNDGYSSFGVEVYEASRDEEVSEVPYQYLVVIDLGGLNEHVAVPSFPDLLALLQKVVPIASGAGVWQIQSERYTSEIEDELASKRQ